MKAATWIGVAVVAGIGLTAAVWAADPLDTGPEKRVPTPAVTAEQHTPAHGETGYVCEFDDGDCANLHDACYGVVEDTGTETVSECDWMERAQVTKGKRTQYRCGHWYRWMPGHRNRCGWNDCGGRDRGRRDGGC
jgi:hypothetical protein